MTDHAAIIARIQLRRTAGWRMPEGAVHVARPGFWGNPFRHGDRAVAARLFRVWLTGCMRTSDMLDAKPVRSNLPGLRQVMLRQLPNLRGKTLACWCPVGAPCHGDVLLELANSPLQCTAVRALAAKEGT